MSELLPLIVSELLPLISKSFNEFDFGFSKIGDEQSQEDAEDGPPELLVSF